MRVIAGTARGTLLIAPGGHSTRPIADRVKETLFAILGNRVLEARMVDLYAGTGAIGIEALSRGAASVDFVEHNRDAVSAIRRNLERTRLGGGRVHALEVERFLAADGGPWDLAVLDPPYEVRDIVAPLRALAPRLERGASVVIKHFWRTALPDVNGLAPVRERRFGETMLSFWEVETP
jgi:16S rRNA (guanine966-N2)-methyltransferase